METSPHSYSPREGACPRDSVGPAFSHPESVQSGILRPHKWNPILAQPKAQLLFCPGTEVELALAFGIGLTLDRGKPMVRSRLGPTSASTPPDSVSYPGQAWRVVPGGVVLPKRDVRRRRTTLLSNQ